MNFVGFYQWIDKFTCAAKPTFKNQKRHQLFQKLLEEWQFLTENTLPIEYLVKLWPDISDLQVEMDVSVRHSAELPYGERAILGALVQYLSPTSVFEFGTFSGATTKLIADMAGVNSTVHTIDLPSEEFVVEKWVDKIIGQCFREKPEYNGKIISHRCNTRDFDFSPFSGSVDLIFIDASHEYEDVLLDSKCAFDMLSDDGVIVWDDYQPITRGVVLALNELSQDYQLVRVALSRLVLYRKKQFPNIPNENKMPWRSIPNLETSI